MNYTIERGSIYPVPTLAEFRRLHGRYRGPLWRSLLGCLPGRRDFDRGRGRVWSVNWYGLAFQLHLRCPNKTGHFANGPEAKGAQWCLPWNFHRLYYAARYGK